MCDMSCLVSEILQVFCAETDPHPNFWGCSRWTRSPMLGSVGAKTLSYSAVSLLILLSTANW